ncbi:hypothetical protein E5163_08860 [Marinicauda algicola]|uniref:Uncharacterized protein n=1 Tax=Marinicauda algicola TaxID=2029849 RepID=A0A4S2H1P5_9PROT|nr:hypothetical protein [Marinicauda algicola]TGY89218.1 hypothetical protein E5163_08860 [Marinicauda algicola]
MANLPTAHASQGFGRKTVDFYAAPGQVVGSDPRARADERRIQDVDGARHAVRLSESRFALAPGDLAAVLRVQPGPARKSRPVAVINYSESSWTRTQPEASAVLAKAGVARNLNWLASMLALLAAMAVVLWPALRAFLVELFPASLSALPAFDVFALTASAMPDLAAWRLSGTAGPLAAGIEGAVPALAGHGLTLVFAGAVALGAVIAFAARSWRLLWLPLLIGAIGVGAIGLAGPQQAALPALLALAGVTLLFLIGGAINRARDVWRLEQRIARLADHLLRHPPEEMVAPAGASAHAGADTLTLDSETAETDAGAQPGGEPEARGEDTQPAGHASATAAAAAAAERAARETGALKRPAARGEDEAMTADSESEAGSEAAAESASGTQAAQDRVEVPEGEAAEDDETGRPDGFVARVEAGEPALAEPGDADGVTAEGGDAEDLRDEIAEKPAGGEDPRYAARDISLPPPPPMPRPSEGEDSETATTDAEEPARS